MFSGRLTPAAVITNAPNAAALAPEARSAKPIGTSASTLTQSKITNNDEISLEAMSLETR